MSPYTGEYCTLRNYNRRLSASQVGPQTAPSTYRGAYEFSATSRIDVGGDCWTLTNNRAVSQRCISCCVMNGQSSCFPTAPQIGLNLGCFCNMFLFPQLPLSFQPVLLLIHNYDFRALIRQPNHDLLVTLQFPKCMFFLHCKANFPSHWWPKRVKNTNVSL